MAAARLTLLAWALWLGGWLGFGTWGLQHWPLVAGGLGALALWLLMIALLQGLGPRRHVTPAAMLLAAAAALLGAPAPWPAALAGAALLLAVARAAGWRRCALLPLSRAPGADPADWPRWAASAAMLPMMAGLPAMAGWCSAAGWPLPLVLGLHVVLMVAPAWAGPARPGWVAGAMGAGALALWWLPGLDGLMAASMLQAVACGLAWRLSPKVPMHPARRHPLAVGVPAVAVLLLGVALAAFGPLALMGVHALLSAAAVLGALAAGALKFSAGRRRPAVR
ncbi:MAG: hypothetical protein IV093_02315 [Rubrivivax sp.]|nr:hypothetical protein [Rubrivivax sp.]